MILATMLQRLYAAITSGPGLNARPHGSRQRMDLLELAHLNGTAPESTLATLLANPDKPIEFPARTPAFRRPDAPETEWTDEQRATRTAAERQTRTLAKAREIAADAADYYNDHGENALFLGFPLLSIPAPEDRRDASRNTRILAPLLLAPVSLAVRRDTRAGLTLQATGEGAALLIPNPALIAWIEQRTGTNTENLFADETAEDPWREIREVIEHIARATGLPPETPTAFDATTPLRRVPRTDDLPAGPALIPAAVLGLFPIANPGLLRDTQWMLENETTLRDPVRPFLSPAALTDQPDPAETTANTPAAEHDDTHDKHTASDPAPHTPAPQTRAPATPLSEDLLVTRADPCQAEAVRHARATPALVIHGPPGTGKSQTIANIIGDHLARGKRVLFVCDKRTALDVVKYRLDNMGLDALCGVIHDSQRDRRDFYLGLRERLENLAQQPLHADPRDELQRVNQRLDALQKKLRDSYDSLHATDATPDARESFHQLCAAWFALTAEVPLPLPETEGLTPRQLDENRAAIEEATARATTARWPQNPFPQHLGMTLDAWFATDPATIATALRQIATTAETLDNHPPAPRAPLAEDIPLADQARARQTLITLLENIAQHPFPDLGKHLLAPDNDPHTPAPTPQTWRIETASLEHETTLLHQPLERELLLQTKPAPPTLATCNQHLLALQNWQPLATAWHRHFALAAKRAAREALAPLALPLTPDATERAIHFYTGLRARHLWADIHDRLLHNPPQHPLPPDATLQALAAALPPMLDTIEAADHPHNAPLRPHIHQALTATNTPDDDNTAAAAPPPADPQPTPRLRPPNHALRHFTDEVQRSLQRINTLEKLRDQLAQTTLFTPAAPAALTDPHRNGATPAAPAFHRLVEFQDTLEECIKLLNTLAQMDAPLRQAATHALDAAMTWRQARPALHQAALAAQIRHHLRTHETPARIDTRWVEAAFSELRARTTEKQALVRRHILAHWQTHARARLLAATGTRLNPAGAALKQRLHVRGQKSMKLRQMLAAGETPDNTPDPLFDICPVWLTSPATVAQIFPRKPLFDVIIFDEASQCRLEEALPALLRAHRVVIAGDPKQLPPTRFFENAHTESDDTEAETPEELFQQQQSGTEDLLGAALNLNVQETFLDVHYRSRDDALIGFSNDTFYGARLQPIPGHPRNRPTAAPIRLVPVNGQYRDRANPAEAQAVAELVSQLLNDPAPPSIGIACFNLNQRDHILNALDERAATDAIFAAQLETARQRRGRDSFEGLFVKNLENVQGDERDHIIICTTFGPDAEGRFRRNFGALTRAGGERRLNVLVTRAREAIHVLTSIPRTEYMTDLPADTAASNGRRQLYAYLRYAERLGERFEHWQRALETARRDEPATMEVGGAGATCLTESLARAMFERGVGSTAGWGNAGFCVDVALTHPERPADVTVGVLVDFTRYEKTPDPVLWENFRSEVLESQGWTLHRIWTPALFRDSRRVLREIEQAHCGKV